MNPAEKKLLQASALEILKKGRYFENVTPQKATSRLNHLQEEPSVMDSIAKSFVQKRETLLKQTVRIRPEQQRRNVAAPGR